MEEREFQRYVEQIARKRHLSKEAIIEDIEACIEKSLRQAHLENDTEIIKQWEEIPAGGELPTAYEFISYVAKIVLHELEQSNGV